MFAGVHGWSDNNISIGWYFRRSSPEPHILAEEFRRLKRLANYDQTQLRPYGVSVWLASGIGTPACFLNNFLQLCLKSLLQSCSGWNLQSSQLDVFCLVTEKHTCFFFSWKSATFPDNYTLLLQNLLFWVLKGQVKKDSDTNVQFCYSDSPCFPKVQ